MKWTPLIVGSLYLAAMTACGGNRGDNNRAGTTGSGMESGSMQNGANGTMSDTSMSSGGGGGVGDTAPVRSDSATTSGAMDTSATSGAASARTRTGSTGAGTSSTGSAGQSSKSATGMTGQSSKHWKAGAGGASDSAKGNQTKSGVTNTKTGKSTLGKGVTTTRPDQGQPVTSKGDTIRSGNDSSSAAQ
jgi:hypothetical protein